MMELRNVRRRGHCALEIDDTMTRDSYKCRLRHFGGEDKASELGKTAEAKKHCLCSAKGERGFLRFRNTG